MGRCSFKKTFYLILLFLIAVTLLCFKLDTANIIEEAFFSKIAIKPIVDENNDLNQRPTHHLNLSVYSHEEQLTMQLNKLTIEFKCGVHGIVTIKSGGRLGNIMGEYATLLAIALRDNVFPILQHRTHATLTKHFKSISIPSIKRLKCPLKWSSMNLGVYNRLNKTERILLAREGVFIDGYPTSVSMFHRHRSKVQKQFVFKSHLKNAAQSELHKMRAGILGDVSYIGVHVRRTDYEEFLRGRYNGRLVGESYFKRAMDYFRQRYPRRLFVVASDDMEWCQSHLKPDGGDVVFAGNRNADNPAEDMALLSSCNHSIITYGNFGFWSAYLAGGETILSGNISETPTELQRSILSANINGWQFFPGF